MNARAFVRFQDIGLSASGKTRRIDVQSTTTGVLLGGIGWYGPWRKYCFTPLPGMVFDAGCLREIAAFCETATREHRDAGPVPDDRPVHAAEPSESPSTAVQS